MSYNTRAIGGGDGIFRGDGAGYVDTYYRLYEEYLREWRLCASRDGGSVGDVGIGNRGVAGPEPPVWVGGSFGLCKDYGGFGEPVVGGFALVGSDDKAAVVSEDVETNGVDGEDVSGVRECVGMDRGREALDDGLKEDVVRGKHWKKNQKKAARRKFGKSASCASRLGFGEAVGGTVEVGREEHVKTPLRRSLEEKWRMENELKIAKAARELELLKAEDLNAVKKLRERKVQGATERTMVQIEKAHASLVQTGNVPGVRPAQQGFCQTVVDGEVVESVPGLSGGDSKGCSISPSSSISEREVREMMKELEDAKAKINMLERREKRMGLAYDVLGGKEHVAVSVVDGSVPESARQALDKVCGKGDWEAVGDLDMDPDTLYLQMDYSNKFDYGGCY